MRPFSTSPKPNSQPPGPELSLTQLAQSLDQCAAAVLITSPEGVIEHANRHFHEITGYTPEEILGTTPRLLQSGKTPPETYRSLWETIRQGNDWRGELEDRHKSGRLVWLHTAIHPWMEPDGRIAHFVALMEDVSEAKRAQQELKNGRILLERLMESSLEPLIRISPQQTIFPLNPAAERVLASSSRASREGDPLRCYQALHGRSEPCDDSEGLCPMQEVKRTGKPITLIHRHVVRNGVELFQITSFPEWDAEHRFQGLVQRHQRLQTGETADSETRLFQSLFEQTQQGIALINPENRLLVFNPPFERLARRITGKPARPGALFPECVPKEFQDPIRSDLEKARQGEAATSAYLFQDTWCEFHFQPLYSPDHSLLGISLTVRDITARKKAEAQVEHMAFHDPLTDLPNRRLFQERLQWAMAQARRARRLLAVLFIDLDFFKEINDALGHAVGDGLLKAFGRRLSQALREGDTLARLGGDEFVVLVTDLETPGGAAAIAQKILALFEAPFVCEGHTLHATASLGVSLFPGDGETLDELQKNADAAMYHAKTQGRNTYAFHSSQMNAALFERLTLEHGLRQAIDQCQFRIFFQPQFNLKTGAVTGMEALVRWQHPQQGLLTPDRFIRLAEANSLILPLGNWILENACSQAHLWTLAGFQPLRLAINLSARQFHRPTLVNQIREVLQATRLLPHYLTLEITEASLLKNFEHSLHILNGLKKLGVRIAIDDYGLGCASINCLRQAPVDALKIDLSFIRESPFNPVAAGLVSDIHSLAKSLKKQVFAEGVETEAQLAFLRHLNCDEFQGFLRSPAVPGEEIPALLQKSWPNAHG